MHPVTVEAILAFAQGLVGQQLHTLHQGRLFTIADVDIPNQRITFVTSQGNDQLASGPWLQETCETFNQSHSYHPSDYTHTHGVTYTLALISLYQESLAANA